MNEEEKAINFLKNKTTNYSLSGEALHYYSILYYLIINLQQENQQLKEKLEASEKARKEAIEFINNINDWEICSKYDCMYKDDVLDVLRVLDIDKGE